MRDRVNRRWVAATLGCLGVTVLAVAVPSTVAAQPPPGTTCSFFPADSVFNTDISNLPANTQGMTWMSNMAQNAYLHPDFGTFAQQYGIPINVAPPPSTGLSPTFAYDSESDHPAEGYPISPSTNIEGGSAAPSGSDRHALVVDKNRCKLYEIYNLQDFTTGQTPTAGSGATWDLSSDSMRPDGWTSADAAGLPIAPLLLRPDEILSGSITHAIRFTAHCTNSYIWPASHQAGLCNSGYPPMGARFRLKKTFDVSHYSASARVVLAAYQRYGLILADNGSDWYFQGTTDDWWGTAGGASLVSELKTIPASQFEAVDESGLRLSAGSYQAATRSLPFKGMYTLDAFGGVNADSSPPLAGSAYWPGWKIARTAQARLGAGVPTSGLVLDGYGGLHWYGAPVSVRTTAYWSGWDIARDFAFLPDGSGGYVLDGYGGLHAFAVGSNPMPPAARGVPYWGWDIARRIVIFSDGTGGYVMDGYGGLHPFAIGANAMPAVPTGGAYWPGWQIARSVALVPGTHAGYLLDGYGGLHPFNAAPAAAAIYWGWDIARSVWLVPGSTLSAPSGYVLDGYGGAHPFGGAPVVSGPYWPGQDIARTIWGF